MARILITQRLVDGALERLESSEHQLSYRDLPSPIPRPELLERIADAEALICLLSDRIDDEVLASGPRLLVIANVAVGYDNIDTAAAARRGVAVVNTPGVLDDSTADLALELMLAARRRTSDAEALLRSGRWEGWSLGDRLGRDLTGATLGLVGYGRIARKVAQRAAGFDMELLHHSRHDTGVAGWQPSLLAMAARCEVLSIHVPLTEATRGLVSAEVLAALPPSAVVINTARGPILDEGALAHALEAGLLWGAGLDVYDGEPQIDPRLLAAPHTVLLPHIGSATIATRRAMCELAISGALTVLEGDRPANLVSPA